MTSSRAAPASSLEKPTHPPPRIVVVMGVSGSGKSTVGAELARRLGWRFVDGDDFHSPEHVARMHAGIALDDAARAPWLAAVAGWIRERLSAGETGVVACSALRRAYRDTLAAKNADVRFAYLKGDKAMLAARIAGRHGHFMPASLLDSQFATLEEPEPDEAAVEVGIADRPETIAAEIARRLGLPATEDA